MNPISIKSTEAGARPVAKQLASALTNAISQTLGKHPSLTRADTLAALRMARRAVKDQNQPKAK